MVKGWQKRLAIVVLWVLAIVWATANYGWLGLLIGVLSVPAAAVAAIGIGTIITLLWLFVSQGIVSQPDADPDDDLPWMECRQWDCSVARTTTKDEGVSRYPTVCRGCPNATERADR